MKTKLFAFVTILISSFFSTVNAQTTQYEWDYVNTLQNEWFKKICTKGLDTVYVVGNNGLIAQSTDRASTWNKQYPVTSQLNDIIFCNHTTGFAVGNGGTILKTTDAGVNWTVQNSGITNNLNAIAATGVDNIWAVGENGTVIFSTNAGLTWQLKDFSISAKLNDVSFRNNMGYIVGNAHTCFFSSNKGNNWAFNDITVENPYNEPDSIFDLLSVNQTENHTSILYGRYLRGELINVDNNKNIQLTYPLNYITNFVMKNDSIGYGLWIGCAIGCFIAMPVINILNSSNSQSHSISLSNFSSYSFTDYMDHADMSFVNDSIEYLVAGHLFFHLKRYVPVIYNGLNGTGNKKISLMNSLNELTIQFENETLEKIELYGITGLKILSEKINKSETSRSFNITGLPKGIYIIRTYYRDNTFTNIKWIIQ